MDTWAKSAETDPSLVRRFVGSVLELAAPPYSRDFVVAVLRITAGPHLRSGGREIQEFLAYVSGQAHDPPLPPEVDPPQPHEPIAKKQRTK